MQTDDIAAWLTQIWDEQEAAEHGKFRTVKHVYNGATSPDGNGIDVQADEGGQIRHLTHEEYLAEFCEPNPDPFTLARIAADRQILALHSGSASYCAWTHDDRDTHQSYESYGPCDTARLLALPYADRPGYREEWRIAQ